MPADHVPSDNYIIEGDFDVYIAPEGTPLPTDLDTTTDGSLTWDTPWFQLGFKDGGVKFSYNPTVNKEYVDEMEEAAKGFVERADATLELMVKQADAETFEKALNGEVETIAAGGGQVGKTITHVGGGRLTYYRMVLHGLNDDAFYFLWDFYRVANAGGMESTFKKGNAIVVPFKFDCYGDYTKPRGRRLFAIHDMTAVPTG